MSVRPTFFVDRSLGKKVGICLRQVGANMELHDDHFEHSTPDSVWIPEVSQKGWVILTKDKNIRRASGEREVILLAQAKMFTLTSGNMNGAEMARLFIDQLESMEQIVISELPPFVYVVGHNGLQRVFPRSTPLPDTEAESPNET